MSNFTKMITLKRGCHCIDWCAWAIYVMNVENYAAYEKIQYLGKPFTHCPWCGRQLTATHKMEG